MKEINNLKEEIKGLKVDILRRPQACKAPSTCCIYVICKECCSAEVLASLLSCPVLNAIQVGAGLSWKVKIDKACLYDAIRSSCDSHYVHIWKNKRPKPLYVPQALSSLPDSTYLPQRAISIVTWNCRGYFSSAEYLHHLISVGVDVIVLQEHWLWPYELTSLDRLHPDFAFHAISDNRLTSTSDLNHGCGGVAICGGSL